MEKLLVVLVVILMSCSTENKSEKLVKIDELFEEVLSLKIQDSLGVGAFISNANIKNDTLIYYTELMSNGIYETNLNSGKTRKIGSNGMGPGEYIMPKGVLLKKDSIFFTDQKKKISVINRRGKSLKEITSVHRFTDNTLCKTEKGKIFAHSNNTEFMLYDINGKGYIQNSKYFFGPNTKHYSSLAPFVDKNKIYIIHPLANKISILDTEKKETKKLKIKNILVGDWDKLDVNKSFMKSDFEQIEKRATYFYSIGKIRDKIVLQGKNPKGQNFLYLLDAQGELKFYSEYSKPIIAYWNDKIISVSYEKKLTFHINKLKEGVLN
jgi:hypothetical protein